MPAPFGVRELARRFAFERLAASPVKNRRQVAGVNGDEQARALPQGTEPGTLIFNLDAPLGVPTL